MLNKARFCSAISISVGIVFVISSLFKWIGIRTFAITVDQFCSFLGYEIIYGHGLLIAVMICTAELMLGLAAFHVRTRRYVIWVYPIALGFFTYITYLNATSLYGQIESCGCFGEVIHLTPMESFAKNVILLVMSMVELLISYNGRKKTT